MQKLIGYVRLILACDLSVIVDFHPSDMHPDYLEQESPPDPTHRYLRIIYAS